MIDPVQKFQCQLCNHWKGIEAQHPHPHFVGLCRTCVKPMNNKTLGHNKRAARKNRNVSKESIPTICASDWVTILRKHNFCCAHCGVKSTKKAILTLDHIYPLSLGGFNLPFNIQPLCNKCHSLKDLAPTILPWEMEEVSKKAAKTAKRKKARNKDFQVFKGLGVFPSGEWFKKVKRDYDKYEEYKFYKNLHSYIIERLLIYWLNKTVGERESRACQSFDQAA